MSPICGALTCLLGATFAEHPVECSLSPDLETLVRFPHVGFPELVVLCQTLFNLEVWVSFRDIALPISGIQW